MARRSWSSRVPHGDGDAAGVHQVAHIGGGVGVAGARRVGGDLLQGRAQPLLARREPAALIVFDRLLQVIERGLLPAHLQLGGQQRHLLLEPDRQPRCGFQPAAHRAVTHPVELHPVSVGQQRLPQSRQPGRKMLALQRFPLQESRHRHLHQVQQRPIGLRITLQCRHPRPVHRRHQPTPIAVRIHPQLAPILRSLESDSQQQRLERVKPRLIPTDQLDHRRHRRIRQRSHKPPS